MCRSAVNNRVLYLCFVRLASFFLY